MKRLCISHALLALLLCCADESSAGFMTVQHLFPGTNDVQYQSTFEVGSGVDLATFHDFAYRDLDVETVSGGFTFSLGMNASFTFDNVAGNALRLIDTPDDLFGIFQSVSLVSTNISGFDASRITLGDDQVQLRFAGLNVSNASEVMIRVNTETSAVPEPSSLALLGMGSLSLFGYGWRRRKTQTAA